MTFSLSDLQHVTLSAPYKMLDDQFVRDLFLDTCNLKIKGYGEKISHDYVSLDTWDFIGIHEIACAKDGDRLVPLMSYKSCPLDLSAKHSVKFPGLACIDDKRFASHKNAVGELIENAEKNNRPLTYVGAFTMHPGIADRRLKATLYQIYLAQSYWHMLSQGFDDILALAMLQFNTDTSFIKMGLDKLQENGETLNSFRSPSVFGQEVEFWLFSREGVSDWLKELCKKLEPYWLNRILIDGDNQETVYQEAA